jgi:hypothetical protein
MYAGGSARWLRPKKKMVDPEIGLPIAVSRNAIQISSRSARAVSVIRRSAQPSASGHLVALGEPLPSANLDVGDQSLAEWPGTARLDIRHAGGDAPLQPLAVERILVAQKAHGFLDHLLRRLKAG